jgi:hypothetical protein
MIDFPVPLARDLGKDRMILGRPDVRLHRETELIMAQAVEKNRANLPDCYDAFRNALFDRGFEDCRYHHSC